MDNLTANVVAKTNGKFGVQRIGGTDVHGNFDTFTEALEAIMESDAVANTHGCDKAQY